MATLLDVRPDGIPGFQGLGSADALQALGDVLPDALFTTDLDGRVTYWNRAAERITGWSRAEALGGDCSLLAGDAVNGCSCGRGPLRCGLAESGYSSRSCTARTKDGRYVQLVKTAAPLYSADGLLLGAIETFTDVGAATVGCPTDAARPTPDRTTAGLVGASPAMRELNRMVALIARSSSNVLVHGESGTGKGLVAEAIHALSDRSGQGLVRVSCSDGTASGDPWAADAAASERCWTQLEAATYGTVVLDEIGDMSPTVQTKLLRFLEGRPARLGPEQDRAARGPRFVCTTHHDVRQLVATGRLRADLFFRLGVLTLEVPPLRDRSGDVALLAQAFLAQHRPAAALGATLDADALRALEAYAWPGNVRELHNVLEAAVLRAGGARIGREHLPRHVLAEVSRVPRHGRRPDLDREAVTAALEAARGNRAEAARRLGLSRVALWKRLKKYGLEDPGPRTGE